MNSHGKSKKKNYHKIKQYLITLPRWHSLKVEETKDWLMPTSWGAIVEEEHDEKHAVFESMIHYHISVVLEHAITHKKMVQWWVQKYPEDWKRVKIEATKSFEKARSYLKKESLKHCEWGVNPRQRAQLKLKPEEAPKRLLPTYLRTISEEMALVKQIHAKLDSENSIMR